MQNHLAGLYEAPTNYDIYDFLITDARLADALTPRGHCNNDERLIVSETDDHLDISIYVDGDTLALLRDDDPLVALHDGNLSPLMLALEGVSHFHYLCWNAEYDKPVTLLELELQAEVDKYVTAVTLLGAQGGKADAATVHERLFNQIHFHQDLPDERLERYQHANHYAAKYCRALTSNFPSHGHQPKFISELRRFYRLTQNEKIRRIESAGS
ncbi:MAG: hypothetical protein QF609_09385 [Gammaproteobacteria bacterium]|nr:hypothetical protein [Gammaproteobacteria bacterium]